MAQYQKIRFNKECHEELRCVVISRKLKRVLRAEKHNETEAHFAQRIGLTRSHISHLISGDPRRSSGTGISTLYRIFSMINRSLADILPSAEEDGRLALCSIETLPAGVTSSSRLNFLSKVEYEMRILLDTSEETTLPNASEIPSEVQPAVESIRSLMSTDRELCDLVHIMTYAISRDKEFASYPSVLEQWQALSQLLGSHQL